MDLDLLIDLHLGNPRQGPGGDDQTRLAARLAGLDEAPGPLRIADIGCGTGASALVLAADLDAEITAVDLSRKFLDGLEARAVERGLADRITPLECSMDGLPFGKDSLDAVWSEGAVYNMGFENGIRYFREFLKPGGVLAVSEITWLTHGRPPEIERHWNAEYPGIATAGEKIRILGENGYALEGYFPLPETCWTDNYYTPLEAGFEAFLARHASEEAGAIVEAERAEIALYRKYNRCYGYGFYVARRV